MRLLCLSLLVACATEQERPKSPADIQSESGQPTEQPSEQEDADELEDDPEEGPEDEQDPEEAEENEDFEEPLGAPIAVVTGPERVAVDDEITLSAEKSHEPTGADIVSHEWQCDDGTTAQGSTLTMMATEIGDIKCEVTVTSESGLNGSASKKVAVREPVAPWTVMVFINGDNNLEDAGIEDINEMEAIGSTEDVNVLVQFDRAEGYTDADGDWTGARRYRIEKGDTNGVDSPVLQDLGEVDSGAYETVVDFVAWSAENYPAQRYAIVFWNHGWSWYIGPNANRITKGVSDDEESGNSISIAEGDLSQALSEMNDILGHRLEIVGMDACIMQGWEMAHEAAPYANYYVASQDYEGWDGWEYTGFLSELVANPDMQGDELGESIARTFIETGDLSQSVIDLSLLSALEFHLDSLAQALIDGGDFSAYHQSASRSYSYDGDWGVDHDLVGLLSGLKDRSEDPRVRNSANRALELLNSVIVSNYASDFISGANGLSIYSPTEDSWGFEQSYLSASWADETLWDDMLKVIFNR